MPLNPRDQQIANQDTTISRVSSLGREQIVSVTDLISEGPIEGLVTNESSIYLNEDRIVPVEASSIPGGTDTRETTLTVTLNSSSASVSDAVSIPAGGIRLFTLSNIKSANVTMVTVTNTVTSVPDIRLTASSAIFNQVGPCTLKIVGEDKELQGNIVTITSTTVAVFRSTALNPAAISSFLADASGKTVQAKVGAILTANAASGTNITLSTSNTSVPTGTYNASVSSVIYIGGFDTFGVNSAAPVKFEGVSAQFRTGTAFQAPIVDYGNITGTSLPAGSGFAAQALEKVDSKSKDPAATPAAPPEYRGTSIAGFGLTAAQAKEVDEIRLTFSYASLYNLKTESGAEGEGHAFYRIQLTIYRGLESSTVTLVDRRRHSAKSKGPIIFEEIINLEPFKPFSDFSVKVTRLTRHDGTAVDNLGQDGGGKWDIIGTSAIANIVSIIKEPLAYPYSAYANVTFSSKEFTNMPTRTYHTRGLKVLVPSNYTTREENNSNQATYSGLWNGAFRAEKVYTNNPAWVFYDILTNNRYGLGEWLSATDIDKYALYRIGRYCDELVDNGKGGLEPRFTANLYLTKATDAYKVLKDMATIFRGILYWLDGNVTAVIDQAKDPIYTFSKANVIDGAFSYESTGSKTRANQIIVTWNNPTSGYALEPLIVEDRQNIIETGRIITEQAVAFGCTSEGQAYRYGKWKLWTAVNQTEVVSFSTAIDAAFLAPGDVITIQDADRYGVRYGGRISQTGTLSTTRIPLDSSITLSPGYTYEVSVLVPGNDTETGGTTEPTTTTVETRTVSPSSYPTETSTDSLVLTSALSVTPSRESVWVVKQIHTATNSTVGGSDKKYRILGIAETDKHQYSITAVEHYDEKFDDIEGDFTLALGTTFPVTSQDTIPAPSEVVLFRTPDYNKGGDEFQIQWSAPKQNGEEYPYVSGYEMVHNIPGYSETISLGASQRKYLFTNVPDDVYIVGVRTVSSIGTRSAYRYLEFKIEDVFGLNIPREAEGLAVGAKANLGITLDTDTNLLAFEEGSLVLTPAGSPTDSFSGTIPSLNTIPTGTPDGEYFVLFDRSAAELKLIKYRNDSPLEVSFWYDAADAGANTPESRFVAKTGTAYVNANTTNVIGSQTSVFTTEFAPGDIIRFGTGLAAKVVYVKSDALLVIDRTFSSNITNAAIYSQPTKIDFILDAIIGKVTISSGASSFISYVNIDRTLTGLDAISVNLIPSSQVIRYEGTTETDSINFTVEAQGTVSTPEYAFYVNDVLKQAKGLTDTFTLADEDEPAADEVVVVKVELYQGETVAATDVVSIYGISNGSDSVLGYLTNESHVEPANSDGDLLTNLDDAGGTFKVFSGTTDITTGNSVAYSVVASSGITASINSTTGVYTITAMSASKGSATFRATVPASAVNNSDTGVTVDKVYSISKSISGVDGTPGSPGSNGTNARAISLSAGTLAFAYASDGTTPSPANTTITATALNAEDTVYYDFLLNGVSVQNTTTNTYTYTPQAAFGDMPDSIEVRMREGSGTSDVLATDGIAIVGLRDAINGVDGDDGINALTLILSNEAHTLPTTSAGIVTYTGSGTTIRLYEGSTELTYDGTGTTNGTWKVAASATGITAGAITDSGSYATVAAHSAMTADSATITYTITGKRANGDAISLTKTQSLAKSIQGNPGSNGTNARAVTLSAGTLAFAYDTAGATPSPANTVLTATALNTVGTVYYQFLVDGVSKQHTTTNTYTYTPPASFATMPQSIEVRIREGNTSNPILARDSVGIVGLRDVTNGVDGDDGLNALTVVLTNDAHTLSTTFTGTVTYTGSGTDIYVYEGSTALTYDGSGTTNGTWKVTVSASDITSGAVTDQGSYARVAAHSAMTAANASVTYTITGKRANGDTFTIVKTQSLSKSVQGSPGSNGVDSRTVSLSAGALAFAYAADGSTPSPANTTVTATSLNTIGTVYYDFLLNGTSVQNTTTSTYTYTPQASFTNMPDTLEVNIREGGSTGDILAKDTIAFLGLRDAINGTNGTTPPGVNINLGLVLSTGMSIDDTYLKLSRTGTSGWTAGVRSTVSYKSGAIATLIPNQTNKAFMFGLNTDPAANDSYTSIDYAYYLRSDGIVGIYENGASRGTFGNYTAGDIFQVVYDNNTIKYYHNSTIDRTITISENLSLFFDSSFNSVGNDLTRSFGLLPFGGAGRDALTIILSNDSHTVPVDTDGTITYTGSGTTIRVYEGTTELVYDGLGSANSRWTVSGVGSSITVGTATDAGNFVTYGDHSAITADTATVTYTIAGKRANGSSFSVDKVQTISKSKAGDKGDPGNDGYSNVIVYAYQRSASALTTNPGAVTVSLTTGQITTATLANSWSKTIPSGTNPLYVTAATASGTGTEDTIAANEWSAPVKFVENGTNGTNGLNVATVLIYLRSSSSTAPTTKPSGNTTYTFATGAVSFTTANSWTATVPTSGGDYLWVRQATASAAAATDTIADTEWSTATLLSVNGTDGGPGAAGLRTVQGYLYYEKSTAGTPSAPAGNTYTFSTGLVSGTGIGTAVNTWTNVPRTQAPNSTNTHYIVRYYGTEASAGSSTIAVSYSSVTQYTNFTGVVTFSDGTFSSGSTAITTIDGGNIATGTINARTLTIDATQLVNPISRTENIFRWGGYNEVGERATNLPAGIILDWNATEKAMRLQCDGNVGINSQSFIADHNAIYRFSCKVRKTSVDSTDWYIGIGQHTTAQPGTLSDGGNLQGNVSVTKYTTAKATNTGTNQYFVNAASIPDTNYDEFTFYIIGANRDVSEAPNYKAVGDVAPSTWGTLYPWMKLSGTSPHVTIRFLNWNNATAVTTMYIKDVTVTEIGAGEIIADNIAANAITAEKLEISNTSTGGNGIYMDGTNKTIEIWNNNVLRVKIGKL